MNSEVNEECIFEDRVYQAEDCETDEDEAVWIEKITQEQLKDPVIVDAIDQLNGTGRIQRGQLKHVSGHLNLKGGVLSFENRLVIPTILKKEAIERTHRASHFGQARTTELMKRSYFWAKMSQDIKQFCRSCRICQKVKAKYAPVQPMEQFKDEDWLPGDAVAMDVATLPWGDELFRYLILVVDLLLNKFASDEKFRQTRRRV